MRKLNLAVRKQRTESVRKIGAEVESFRILHVDDDPLMRDVVELALGLDPKFVVMSCESGQAGLAAVPGWQPDLIILDVMMPGMDGPAVLARPRENPETSKIPVIFITSRAPAAERERLMKLGAVAVIAKPFYPATLAETVRSHLLSIKLAAIGFDFTKRLRTDAAKLASFRDELRHGAGCGGVADEFQSFVHKLAGAAGVFDFRDVSATAASLEDAIIERRAGRGAPGTMEANLDALLASIEATWPNEASRRRT
jgi:CheY-like chemotaxis protein/HPt (histidine-containing phosphotransfer) domain-containing protein